MDDLECREIVAEAVPGSLSGRGVHLEEKLVVAESGRIDVGWLEVSGSSGSSNKRKKTQWQVTLDTSVGCSSRSIEGPTDHG